MGSKTTHRVAEEGEAPSVPGRISAAAPRRHSRLEWGWVLRKFNSGRENFLVEAHFLLRSSAPSTLATDMLCEKVYDFIRVHGDVLTGDMSLPTRQ